MDKDKIAHDLALIAVQEQLRLFREDNSRLGFSDIVTNMVSDYKRCYEHIKDDLS